MHQKPIMELFEETDRLFLNRFTPQGWDQMQSFLARLER